MENPALNLDIILTLFDNSGIDEVLADGAGGLTVLSAATPPARPPSPFPTAGSLALWVQALARQGGTRLDPLCGGAGGVLHRQGELFRWHCVLPPLAPDGPLLSIRRHRFATLCLADFAGSETQVAAVAAAAMARRHLLIIGATGAGKTTLLAALLRQYAETERIIAIESVPELPRLTSGWLRLVERRPNLEGVGAVGTTRLVQEALRLRPDRLVIGEVRGPEAPALLAALLSGHGGVVATMHAGSPREAMSRLAHFAAADGWVAGTTGRPGGGTEIPLTVVQVRRPEGGGSPALGAVEDHALHLA